MPVMHTRTSLFHKHIEQMKRSNTLILEQNTTNPEIFLQNSTTTTPSFKKLRKFVPLGIEKILKTMAKFFQAEEITWILQYQYQDFAGLYPKVEQRKHKTHSGTSLLNN